MKKLFIILLVLFCSSTVWSAEEFSFRGVKFGMSKEEVMEIETGQILLDSDNMLTYKPDAVLIQEYAYLKLELMDYAYQFRNSKLISITICFSDMHYKAAYKKFMKAKIRLIDLYGEISDEDCSYDKNGECIICIVSAKFSNDVTICWLYSKMGRGAFIDLSFNNF